MSREKYLKQLSESLRLDSGHDPVKRHLLAEEGAYRFLAVTRRRQRDLVITMDRGPDRGAVTIAIPEGPVLVALRDALARFQSPNDE